MESKLIVVGNEYSVINYNLNKQFCDIKKIIITSDILINSFENEVLEQLFKKLQVEDSNNYIEIINKAKEERLFETHFKSELYQNLQENLSKISGMMDLKLKDYNFMNSISNSKFDVVLRCEDFSISKYYIEKGEIITNIRNLIKKYLEFEGNIFRINRLKIFQIEIFESEEIYKKIILKKDGNNLLLGSIFGFSYYEPIDYNLGNEFYFSIGEEFVFFKNNQNKALFKEYNKLVEKEINLQEKILSNDELININNKSKNINDAIIELYINNKGVLKISNLSLFENSLDKKSNNGFMINKSSKNYDKISILSLRDNLEDDLPNPKYLLIRNESEIKELLEKLSVLKNVDGLIFNLNFYHPILDKIGTILDIDIMFYNIQLQKSLEVKIDLENFIIDRGEKVDKSVFNPFSNIIQAEQKEKQKDEFLERLKNINLNEGVLNNNYQAIEQTKQVSQITESLMSSENSSINKTRGQSNMNWANENNTGKKKSAMDFLLESTKNHELNRNVQPRKEAEFIDATKPSNNRSFIQLKEEYKDQNQQNKINNSEKYFNYQQTQEREENQFEKNEIQTSNRPFFDEFFEDSNYETQNIFNKNRNTNNSFQKERNIYQEDISNNLNNTDYKKTKIDTSKYENILATNIITIPGIVSGSYFVDINTISQSNGGELFFLATNPNDMQNPNLNYILPIELNSPKVKDCYLLLNSANDYFLIDKTQNVNYFLNLSKINSLIKEKILKEIIEKIGKVSLIITKEDLYLIQEHINKIENVFVKDITTNDDYFQIKNKILSFEKIFLMKINNQ